MATKTAATQKPQTGSPPPATSGRRSIGRQANINFNEGSGSGSFTVNEQRGQAENTIQGSIQKTEQEGLERGRSKEKTAADTTPPILPNQANEQTETFSSEDGADTANTIDSLLKIRDKQTENINPVPPPSVQNQQSAVPDASHVAFKNTPHETLDPSQKPTPQQTSPKSQPKNPSKLLERTGKVLMYTSPGGFLIGKLMPRIKERFFAKKEVETVEKNAQTDKPAASTGHHTQKAKPSRAQKASRTLGKLAFYSTPAGLLFFAGNKFLPKSIKAHIPFLSQKKKSQEPAEPKHKKTLLERLSAWNTKTIKNAETRGYDRLSLIRKVKDMKVWKSRAWKYGKYALGAIPAAGYDIHQWQKGRKTPESQEQRENESTTQHGKEPGHGFIRGNSGIWDGKLLKWSPAGMGVNTWKRFISPRMGGVNNRLGGNFGGRTGNATRGMAKNLGKKAGKKLAQKAAQQAAATGAKALILNPAVLAGIAIAVVIILFIGIMFFVILNITGGGGGGIGGGGDNSGIPGNRPPSANPIPGFTIGKTVEKPQYTYANPPEPIVFTITYSYTPASGATIKLSDITIYDALPANTTFSSASGSGKYDSSTNTVSWNLSDPANTSPLALTITPNQDNILISNTAYAQAAATGGSGATPTADNCNGFYSFTYTADGQTYTNPKENFADTDCYYANNFPQTKDEIYTLLKAQDPTNADKWFLQIIPCESSYIPNTYRDHNQIPQTPDPNGAWGLFQVSSTGLHGPFDNGAVPWQEQINNAVNLLKERGWGYWGCS